MIKLSSLTSPDAAVKIAQLLLEQAEVPKPLTLPELLTKAKSSISKMLKNGHTYEDVVRVLASFEVMTTDEEVEAYHSGVKKVKGKESKGKQKKNETASENLIESQMAEAILKALVKEAEIRKGLTREELVEQLREPIEKMLAAHYTYEDISAVMADAGVQISPGTIKSYYREIKRQEEDKTNTNNNQVSAASSTKNSHKTQSKTSPPPQETDSLSSPKTQTDFPQKSASSAEKSHHETNGSKRLKESSQVIQTDLEKEFNL
jgi:hypothetical protein